MRRVSQYLVRDFLKFFGLSLGAFTGLYVLVDFFEKVDRFLEADAALKHYLIFFGCKAPVIAQQLMPMAVLMATFMTLAGLARTSELTAMRASGMSLSRISFPLLVAGLMLSLGSLAMTEYVTPFLAGQAFKIKEFELNKRGDTIYRHHNLWLRTSTGIVQIRLADPQNNELQGIRNFTLGTNFELTHIQQATKARFITNDWELESPRGFVVDNRMQSIKSVPQPTTRFLGFDRAPDDFALAKLETDQLAVTQLYSLYKQYEREGLNSRRLEVDFQARLASPFTCLIMAFLGVPFALQKGRKSSAATGMVLSALVGVSFFVLQAVITAFGYNDTLPSVVAAWSGNLIFLLLGMWLLLTVKE